MKHIIDKNSDIVIITSETIEVVKDRLKYLDSFRIEEVEE